MKVGQVMEVTFAKGSITVNHKTLMGDLRKLFDVGNAYRRDAEKSTLRMESWLAMDSTKEYIALVSERVGAPALVATRGRNGTTQVHLRVLLDAAMYLDAAFKDEVITAFVDNQVLRWRDLSGDAFLDVNAALALHAENVLGKPAHKGHYIQLAKSIREKLLPPDHLGWNYASAEQLQQRTHVEQTLVKLLELGVVRDWEHLKELIEKV